MDKGSMVDECQKAQALEKRKAHNTLTHMNQELYEMGHD